MINRAKNGMADGETYSPKGKYVSFRFTQFIGKAGKMIIQMDESTTVRDLVGRYPQTRPVFEKLGIDYCCGGGKSLAAAAYEHDLKLPSLVDDLRKAFDSPRKKPETEGKDWYSTPLTELISHIVEVHHGFMKTALPWLRSLAPLVLKAHESSHGDVLRQVQDIVSSLDAEITTHMFKEEKVLFPYITALEKHVREGTPRPQPPFGTALNPIHQMELDHEIAGAALVKLRKITHNYELPADACPTFVAMYDELQRMESDLHQHIHLENNILFPRTVKLEEQCKQ
jgi:regulator of cell morphogenesis and NO signaling